jgi:DNA-binding response OmpR family regulator
VSVEAAVEERVLIIEQDLATRELLVQEFSGHGFQVFTTADGSSALFQLGIFQPSAIILSLSLADPDGWKTLQRIRELSNVPIIALVVAGDEQARIESLLHGADYFVTKPFSPRELRARVRALLRRTPHTARPSRQSQPAGD